jgi:alpha-galactosidase
MLEVGNGVLDLTEERSHFALWTFAKAPLIIGCDLTTINNDTLNVLKSELLIRVNQDTLGR